jgi:hypothetical protein
MKTYSQADLLADLCEIFPEFAACWEEDNELDEFRSSSLHSVYMSLLPFLSQISPTPKQWQRLADHLSNAVASGGDQENAADTCVLEHLHQVNLGKTLRPLLSNEARAYVRA